MASASHNVESSEPAPHAAAKSPLQSLRPWIIAAIAVGVLARCTRYLGAWPLWGDETALAVNLLQRDFAGLLHPLDVNQIAPIGFLFGVKSLLQLFGPHEYTFRFIGFAASLTTLWVVYRIALETSLARHAWLPVALLAASHAQIRHAAELKQYALETLVTAVLALLTLHTVKGRWRPAILLLVATPISLLCSLPAAFVGGGIALATLPRVVARRSGRWWAWYAGYGVLLLGSFGLVYALLLTRQMASQGASMDACWGFAFPPLDSPTGFLLWLLETATGVLFAIPVGGEHGASVVTTILFGIGLRRMWMDGDRDFVRLVLATFAVALLASFLRKYPLGGHERLVQYLLPLQVPVIAAGLLGLLERIGLPTHADEVAGSRVLRGRLQLTLAVLLLIGLGNVLRDVARPYHGRSALETRNFSRWFWTDYRGDADLRCVSRAWRTEFHASGPSREYACFREFYAPDLIVERAAVPMEIDGRVGLVVPTNFPEQDAAALASWRDRLADRFNVVSTVVLPGNTTKPFPQAVEFHVIWIEPKPDRSTATTTRMAADEDREDRR